MVREIADIISLICVSYFFSYFTKTGQNDTKMEVSGVTLSFACISKTDCESVCTEKKDFLCENGRSLCSLYRLCMKISTRPYILRNTPFFLKNVTYEHLLSQTTSKCLIFSPS